MHCFIVCFSVWIWIFVFKFKFECVCFFLLEKKWKAFPSHSLSFQPSRPSPPPSPFLFSSPAAQTPPFHQPTFLFRPRSAPPPLCRRQAGPACQGRLPPRGRRGLRESGRCTPPRSLPWRALQGSPAAPIYSPAPPPWTLTWLINLTMDLNHFLVISCGLAEYQP